MYMYLQTCCSAADVPGGCTNGDIRLVGGHGNFSGRVEVCFNNVWGTVCDDDWGRDDSEVVCQQLGFDPEGMWMYVIEIQCTCTCTCKDL